MPKCLRQYTDQDKALIYRNRQRRINYAKSYKYNVNRRLPFSEDDCRRILEHNMPDIELAQLLGRSVPSIQQKRCKLVREGRTPIA